jgi:hypothetical protein
MPFPLPVRYERRYIRGPAVPVAFVTARTIQINTTAPMKATKMLHILKPVAPGAPTRLNRKPPTKAPMIPTMMSPMIPKRLCITALANAPAIPPTINQANHPIASIFHSLSFEDDRVRRPSLSCYAFTIKSTVSKNPKRYLKKTEKNQPQPVPYYS